MTGIISKSVKVVHLELSYNPTGLGLGAGRAGGPKACNFHSIFSNHPGTCRTNCNFRIGSATWIFHSPFAYQLALFNKLCLCFFFLPFSYLFPTFLPSYLLAFSFVDIALNLKTKTNKQTDRGTNSKEEEKERNPTKLIIIDFILFVFFFGNFI